MSSCSYPTYDFCVWRGEDKEYFFSFKYTDIDGTKTPLVLDGLDFSMTIGMKYPKKEFDKLTTQNGRLVIGILEEGEFVPTDKGSSVLRAEFTHEATRKYPEGEIQYDLIKIDSEGKREAMLSGTIEVHSGVSYHA